jgi:signal transduction histidine kinase
MRQEFVATVSHELRTPLAAIYGAALTLRREDVELEEQLKSKLLEVIAEESGRLSDIVNDLLLASQLDTGKLRANVEPCDPLEIAELEIEAAQTHVPENVELKLVAPGGLPAVVADAGQLRQVLSNLIDNAVKYSSAGGEVEVSAAAEDGAVVVSVSDHGPGIPREHQKLIFEKFGRGGVAGKAKPGTGLGLFIARSIAEAHGGSLNVRSTPRQGATFTLSLPLS